MRIRMNTLHGLIFGSCECVLLCQDHNLPNYTILHSQINQQKPAELHNKIVFME